MNISRGIFFWFLCLANEHWPIKALKRSREEPVLHRHIEKRIIFLTLNTVFPCLFTCSNELLTFPISIAQSKEIKCFCTVLKLAPYAHVKCMSCCVKTVLVGLMYDNVWSQHSSPHPGSFGSSFGSGWCLGIGRQTEPSCSSWFYLTRLRPFFYPSVSGRFKRCWNRARPRLACRGNRNKKV